MKKKKNETKKSIDDIVEEKLNGIDGPTVFGEKLFALLPDILGGVRLDFKLETEHSAALFGLIILISGILPYYVTIYDSKEIEANLNGFVIAPFGCGKGVLNFCKIIIERVNDQIVSESDKIKTKHRRYLESLEKHEKRKPDESILPVPDDRSLIIPGNTTKAALIKTMANNKGRGIMFLTEADTLTSAMQGEHGSFSDIIRDAAGHEAIGSNRKGDGATTVPRTYLTVLLSGTPNQILKLMPDVENGLFSRFLFLLLPSTPEFKDVFADRNSRVIKRFEQRAGKYLMLYNALNNMEGEKLYFTYTKAQEKVFTGHFRKLKKDFHEIYSGEMDGSINRLGLIFTRVAMIIAISRVLDDAGDNLVLPSKIVCTNKDFQSTYSFIRTLLPNIHTMYGFIMSHKANHRRLFDASTHEETLQKVSKCLEMHSQGVSYGQIAKEVLGDEKKKGTVWKWCKKYNETK